LLEHYRLIADRFGTERGTILMRRYACCYGHGFRGAKAFRAAVCRARTPEQFIRAVDQAFHPKEA
jgi:tRNA-dihydrouridine synthase